MRTMGRSVALAMALEYREQGRRIAALREHRGFSQEEAARLVGVSNSGYQKWELGGGIRGANLRRLAEVLDTTIEEITGQAEMPEPFSLARHLDANVEIFREFCYAMRDDFARVAEKLDHQADKLDRQYLILSEILAAVTTPEGARVIASGARKLAALAEEAEAGRDGPRAERRGRDRRRQAG